MVTTPILYIVFNRLDTVKQTFPKIREVQPEQLFIAADGPRPDKAGEDIKCKVVREWILSHIDWHCKVQTLFRGKNLGCKYGPAGALQWFFSYVDQGIILEDDCYPDKSFFSYCSELLEKYKDENKIRMISGRNNCSIYRPEKQSYYFTTGGGIWGWATWKREVIKFNPDRVFPPEKIIYEALLDFTDDADESALIASEAQKSYHKNYRAWDYQWGVEGKLNKQVAITPAKNLIKNLGFSPDSTHFFEEKNDFAKLKSLRFPLKHPQKIELDYTLSKKIAHTAFPTSKILVVIRFLKRVFRKLKKIAKQVLYAK